jgi:hypothetical protein
MVHIENTDHSYRAVFNKNLGYAVGKTSQDVDNSFEDAYDQNLLNKPKTQRGLWQGIIKDKFNVTPGWLKTREIATKISGLISSAGMLYFLAGSYSILSSPNLESGEAILGISTGLIGIAALALVPKMVIETSRMYKEMHDWSQEQKLEEVAYGRVGYHSRHGGY